MALEVMASGLVLTWLAFAAGAGQTVDVGRRDREPYLQGFSFPEVEEGRTFRWSEGSASATLSGLAGQRRYQVRLWVATRRPRPVPQVNVSLAKARGTFVPQHGWTPVQVSFVTPALRWDGQAELRLETPPFRPEGGERELGLMLAGIELVPTPRFQPASLPPLLSLLLVWSASLVGLAALRRLAFGWPSSGVGVLAWQAVYGLLVLLDPARYGASLPAVTLTLAAALLSAVGLRALLRAFPRLPERAALLAGLLLGLAASLIVYRRSVLANGPLGWDEADHTLWAHWIAEALRRWDLLEALAVTNRQTFWAPLYSWYQGLVFLLVGETLVTARLAALASVGLGVVAASLLAMQLAPRARRWPWGVAGGLAVAASPRLLTLGSTGMFEVPITLLLLLALAAHVRAVRSGRPAAYLVSALLALGVFLTKFNYGLILMASAALADVWLGNARLERSKEDLQFRLARPAALGYWLPLGLGALAWFGVSPREKLVGFLGFLVNPNTSGYAFLSADNLLFYPRVLAREYLPLGWLIWPLGLGFLWLLAMRPSRGQRVVAGYVLLGLLSALLHPLKSERYIAPMVPMWTLLGLLGMWGLLVWLARRGVWGLLAWLARRVALRIPHPLPALLVVLIALAALVAAWDGLGPVQSAGRQKPILEQALQELGANVPPTQPLLVLGSFAEMSPALLEWYLLTHTARAPGTVEVDPYGPVATGEEADRVLSDLLAVRPDWAVVTLEVVEERHFDLPDYRRVHAWKAPYLQAMARQPGWQETWRYVSNDPGLVVRGYRQAPP